MYKLQSNEIFENLRAIITPDIDKLKDHISLIHCMEIFSRVHEILIAKLDLIIPYGCISKKRQIVWIDHAKKYDHEKNIDSKPVSKARYNGIAHKTSNPINFSEKKSAKKRKIFSQNK